MSIGEGQLTPTQQQTLDEVLILAKLRAAPTVELRSPLLLGRGHGVTTVLRAAAKSFGVPLIGISTALDNTCVDGKFPGLMDLEPLRSVRNAAKKSLDEHGVTVIDDLDLAVCARHLKRSRTLIGEIKGAGAMWGIDVLTQPALLLKSLAHEAAAAGGCIIYSAIEDNFQAFVQEPVPVILGEPTQADYAKILHNRLGAEAAGKIDVATLYSLHSQLSPSELLSSIARAFIKAPVKDGVRQIPETELLLSSVRDALVSGSAVRAEDVEAVDLERFPGMKEIKEELEKFVLFPILNPALAKDVGLTPKRGVLIHGPPGTGKTTVGRWLAHRLQGKFFRVGEMMLHSDIIKVFAAAQAAAPAVVFIDDADIVIGGWRPIDGGRGSDIFRFLLSQMDGLTSRGERQKQNGDVVVILTGQDARWMAKMLLRSGRIELWLKTKLPEPKVKREMMKKVIEDDEGARTLLGKDGDLPDVRAAAQAGDFYCAADIRRIVTDAKVLAAWDKHGPPSKESDPQHGEEKKTSKPKDGSAYLEQAAQAVTDMHREVESLSRSMYG